MLQKASPPTLRNALDAPLTKVEALALYRQLLLVRHAEEKICEEYPGDAMKTPVHLGLGQEGIVVGVCHSAPAGTKTFGTYRNHALYLTVSGDADSFFAELYGKATGSSKGKAGSMHLASPEHGLLATSAVVATTIPLAVGAALAHAYRGTEELVIAFFGDGAVEEGVFWESLNFACLHRLRILFVCEDNGLAIHTPTQERQGFRSIPEAVQGFRCHVESGDGSDVLAVMAATQRLLARMREAPQPGLAHFTYCRLLEHVGIRDDFGAGYRRRPTLEEMERLDPVLRFEREVCRALCAPDELAAVRAAVEAQLAAGLRAARQAPFAAAHELTTDLFA